MKETPLHDLHVALGAKMVEFGGWRMPVQYGPILDEVRTVRSRAGLFDLSHMGRVSVTGADAVKLVDRIATNFCAKIPVGAIRYALFCREDGNPIDDLLVYRGEDEVYLVVNASNTETDLEWLAKAPHLVEVNVSGSQVGDKLVTALAAPDIADRLITMTAASKTFNISGGHTGNVIIADEGLRKRFADRMVALGMSPNAFGMHMIEAAYSAGGADWVEALIRYLDGNRRLFDEGIRAIPGLRSMPLEATYLAWVCFEDAGMDAAEAAKRVIGQARIAVNPGPSFGRGGDSFLRFNLATPRARVAEAVSRLHAAFGDLQ